MEGVFNDFILEKRMVIENISLQADHQCLVTTDIIIIDVPEGVFNNFILVKGVVIEKRFMPNHV